MRQLADIASRAGFTEMLLDDGWQKGRLGTDVDTAKFPDFAATAEYIRSKGLALGLVGLLLPRPRLARPGRHARRRASCRR